MRLATHRLGSGGVGHVVDGLRLSCQRQTSGLSTVAAVSFFLVLTGCEAKPTASNFEAERQRLLTLGYVGGTVEPRTSRLITVHQRDRVREGLNLYNSGHAPEAELMDMDGRVLHKWSCSFEDAFPGAPFKLPPEQHNWRRVHLLPNGDLLAIFEGIGLIKLNRDSKLLWARALQAHHDLQVMPDGRIYILTRRAHVVPRVHSSLPVLEDFISVLDSEGRPLEHYSLLRAFERAGIELDFSDPDIFHTNSLEVLGKQAADLNPAFREGNVLISLRHQNLIAVCDVENRRIVWWQRGSFREQHDPKVLANGNLLLFDNSGTSNQSTIYEFDLTDWRVVWSYDGTDEHPFHSARCGTAQRLENGNTLITESSRGRAFEITSTCEIVWEFHNPHRFGSERRLVGEIFELLRLPQGFATDWTYAQVRITGRSSRVDRSRR